ncbi:cytochrome C biogenesis protein [Opitutaceae bacterium TAV3]|nr:cytochrome C biogenesis protein [Opitutaceae bacterium TAV3]
MIPFTDRTWLWLAAALYFAGFVLGTIALLRDRRHSRAAMYVLLSAAYTLQTFGLYLRGLAVHGCPLGNTFEIFQFTAWSAASLYLVIGATFRLSLLGYFSSMLMAALTVVSLAIPGWDAERRIGIFVSPWIEFHAALALFSYGVFALLALTSLMFLLRHHSLKHKRLGGAFAFLPPVTSLDHISVRLLTAGVVLLGASLVVGSVYWLRAPDSVKVVKIAVTVGVWAAYAAVLVLRLRGRWIAKKFAWACVILYACALASLWPVDNSRQPAGGGGGGERASGSACESEEVALQR